MSLSNEPHGLRLVELLGAISLATDMGTGQPHGHGVRTSVLAVALGRQLGVGGEGLVDMQRVALLRFLGCTGEASDTARLAGGDDMAFMAAMAPATMGAKPEMLRGLIGAVGQGRPLPRCATLVARALSDPGGAKRSLSAHCEVAAMLAERLGTGPRVKDARSPTATNGGTAPDSPKGCAANMFRSRCGSRLWPATPTCCGERA